MMRIFRSISTIVVIGICCVVFDAPVHISLIIIGLMCISGSYETTKSGAINKRFPILISFLLVGIALVIAGFLIGGSET